ncbi:MAG: DNA mismatch repair endonuclease MutL [Gammaproteobacteria bacterium]
MTNTHMIPRIRLLNRLLANQIAAGEVVERPASVVKELLENSIDAKASQIDVTIQQGGFHHIKVRDDGCGIEQPDLRLAVCRHATSKIVKVEDLSYIDTLGFRGEALASIAAVSRFWMSSKPAQQTQAWQVHLNGLDTEIELQPTAHPTGTTVMVEDLFFNTPARRKFLRSERTEYLQIEEVFKRIALSHLNIGFSLTHNQRMIYRLLPATTDMQQQRRVAKIFGNNFIEHACNVDMQATGLALTGWLGLPTLSRSQNDLQYIYLNGRLVRDRVINHALRQAYEDILPTGRNALYILYLTVEPTM